MQFLRKKLISCILVSITSHSLKTLTQKIHHFLPLHMLSSWVKHFSAKATSIFKYDFISANIWITLENQLLYEDSGAPNIWTWGSPNTVTSSADSLFLHFILITQGQGNSWFIIKRPTDSRALIMFWAMCYEVETVGTPISWRGTLRLRVWWGW